VALHDSRSTQFFRDLPYFGLYLQEFPLIAFNTEAPFAHSWTLGIEEKFYIVWPLLAFVVLMRRPSRAKFSAAGVVVLVGWRILDGGVVARLFYPYSFILVGCLIAFLLHDPVWFERLRKAALPLRTTRGMSAATVAMLGVFLLPLGEGPGRFVSAAVFAAWLTIMVLHRGNGIDKFLGRTCWSFLGRVSYAVYLFHSLFLVLMDKLLPDNNGLVVGTAKFVGCLALLLPVCAVIYKWIETPCTEFGRRVAKRFDR
jgi:peptidoglycan/LPS O-acetylase OafA/YrhL